MNLYDELAKLKKEKNAIILAHYYQDSSIQKIADYIGDSLGLSNQAIKTDAEIIVFAGVYFMAETAKILNPNKKVLLPDINARCSLSDSCLIEDFRLFKLKYPNYIVVTYINSSAEVKAESDIICTSSNVLKIIESIPKNSNIIFAPDKNLGKYIMNLTKREMVLWDGVCHVHNDLSIQKIIGLMKVHPSAKLIVHPESPEELIKYAYFVGSTQAMIDFVRNDSSDIYIIATEVGILNKMQESVPNKVLIPAPIKENNQCACSECSYMKMNTLEKVFNCLKFENPEITISPDLQTRAKISLERMIKISS